MEAWIESLLAMLSLPQYGLSTVFVVALAHSALMLAKAFMGWLVPGAG